MMKHDRPRLPARRVGHREKHQAAGMVGVADELLGAVDDVAVALLDRSGPQVGGIRPGLRLGQTERSDMLAGRQLAQPAILLCIVSEIVDDDAGGRIVHRNHGRNRAIAGGDFLQQQRIGHRVDLAAVPFRRRRRAKHTEPPELGNYFGLDPLLLLALGRQRCQPFLREAADHVDDKGIAVG